MSDGVLLVATMLLLPMPPGPPAIAPACEPTNEAGGVIRITKPSVVYRCGPSRKTSLNDRMNLLKPSSNGTDLAPSSAMYAMALNVSGTGTAAGLALEANALW